MRHDRTSALAAVLAAGSLVPGFGSEAFLAPWPDAGVWHHESLTREAAAARGFSVGAASVLAFHATYVDHYLLNPLWLVSGGPARIRAARAVRADLETLHTDDLGGPAAVQREWRRLLGGTACALLWAAHGDLGGDDARGTTPERRTSVARQAVGLGLHAVQDFASHSTWIDDPARRDLTWWEWRAAGGDVADVATGGVEGSGALRHGDLGLRRTGRVPVAVPLRGGVRTPRWLTGAGPGINLDSRWQARIGVRGRTWHEGAALGPDDAFDAARAVALRSSIAWLAELERICERAGLAGLWRGITAGPDATAHRVRSAGAREFEEPRRRAHVLLAAGAGTGATGSDGPVVDEERWFLRVDAALHAAPGRRRARTASRVLGPYPRPPASIGRPSSGVVGAAVAFRWGADDAEVRGLEPVVVPGAGLQLRETWRAAVDLPDPPA